MEGCQHDTESNKSSDSPIPGETTAESAGSGTLNQVSSSNQKETTKPKQTTSNEEPTSTRNREKNRTRESENQGTGTSNSSTPVRQETDGIASFWRGINYQRDVAFLLVCHAVKLMQDDKTFEFTITSEDPEGGKFDDVVIRYKHGNHAFNIFTQAKQKKDASKELRLGDLRSTAHKNNKFSLIPRAVAG